MTITKRSELKRNWRNCVVNKAIRILLSEAKNRSPNYSPFNCPDKIYGHLNGASFSWNESKLNQDLSEHQNNLAIILVLESPHVDEFDSITKMGIGPAQGQTGQKIQQYLPEVLNNPIIKPHFQDKVYDVVLINAVQYQCSLGENPLLYRDAEFLRLWEEKSVREDFKKRLKAVTTMYMNSIIINCCTVGNHIDVLTSKKGTLTTPYIHELGVNESLFNGFNEKFSLKNLVEKEIITICVKIPHFRCAHPSSWHKPKNRDIKE